MHFSAKEKEIIKRIASAEICDLPSYIAGMVPLKEETNTWSNFSGANIRIPLGTIVKMIEDEDALAKELSVFIAFCYKLQGLQLLQIIENSTFKYMPPILMRHSTEIHIPSKISHLFANNSYFEIVSFYELSQFIEGGFLTVEERNLQDERNTRETAQRTTIIVAIVSLLISTATSVGVTYFNYKTYSTERKVSISNLDALKYPIPVSITEIHMQGKDTKSRSNTSSKRGDATKLRSALELKH